MPPKRANPKSYERACVLRKELTPAEKKLWAHLRGNKLNGVSFRRQHAIGNYIVDFVSIKKNSSSNWMEVSIWSKLNTIPSEPDIWNRRGIK